MFPDKFFQHLAPTAQNPKWPLGLDGGTANFFSIALRTNILVATIGFSGTRNRMKAFSMTSDH